MFALTDALFVLGLLSAILAFAVARRGTGEAALYCFILGIILLTCSYGATLARIPLNRAPCPAAVSSLPLEELTAALLL